MIYLDNAATTKVYDCAVRAANIAMTEEFFNPNATYKQAVAAKNVLEDNRAELARLLGAKPQELIYTSCATESNNYALFCGRKNAKGNIVISAGEHPSVYETAMDLRSRGLDVRIAPLKKSGEVDEERFVDLCDENTTLVSVIHVSNETGVVNDIKKLSQIAKSKAPKALFHSDGVQGAVKLGERLDGLGCDLYSISAHKLGAPKGIGLLYVKNGTYLKPFIFGGGQEDGRRSGTQNTPYIAAFTAAIKQFKNNADRSLMLDIRNAVAQVFTENGYTIVGDGTNSGYILCVCIPKIKAEILQNLLSDRGIVVGKGAACSGSKRTNRVLSAMGLNQTQIEGCIRLGFFEDTSRDDALYAAKTIVECVNMLRSGNVG